MDSHNYTSAYSQYDCLLACGAADIFSSSEKSLDGLDAFISSKQDWIFGHINFEVGYALMQLEKPATTKPSFPEMFFFQPEIIITIKHGTVCISSLVNNTEAVFKGIQAASFSDESDTLFHIPVKANLSKAAYLEKIEKIKQHIKRGDCYEMNFCQQFYAESITANPLSLYKKLTAISPAPFATYYKINQHHLLSASPERFIQKQANKLISQPIKGTIKRDMQNPEQDALLKQQLANSEKNQSENVMIVDLVRNDLSRIAARGSVQVEELFGIYAFPQVYQMISTISCTTDTGVGAILKAVFPMGSMTGAPKKRVMELTRLYETLPRGLYSGTVGYIDPSGNFDFNVVIRSILYYAAEKYLEYYVGGGITWNSDPEEEYLECLLKAEGIKKVLQ